MAMRGDDVIGLTIDPATNGLQFLKTEAKSRANLTAQVLTEARSGLDKDGGLPSAHSLAFISARLLEIGNPTLADAIDDALLKHGIPAQSVQHLLFTISGNPPATLLTASLQSYAGPFGQWGVGLHIHGHPTFVSAVYDRVIADANRH
jgi:hypothetical protein